MPFEVSNSRGDLAARRSESPRTATGIAIDANIPRTTSALSRQACHKTAHRTTVEQTKDATEFF
jgi:hypothetical protein